MTGRDGSRGGSRNRRGGSSSNNPPSPYIPQFDPSAHPEIDQSTLELMRLFAPDAQQTMGDFPYIQGYEAYHQGAQTEGEGNQTDANGTQTEGEGTQAGGTQTEGEGTQAGGTQTEGEATQTEGDGQEDIRTRYRIELDVPGDAPKTPDGRFIIEPCGGS